MPISTFTRRLSKRLIYKPIVLYLDQSRVSEMIHVTEGDDPTSGGPHRKDYQALSQLLPRLIRAGRVFCPFSMWHAIETIQFDKNDKIRAGVCRFFDYASQGQSFRFSQDVFLAEIRAAIEKRPCISPLGKTLDCFPAGVIGSDVRRSFKSEERPFSTIVELLRTDSALRENIFRTKTGLLTDIGNEVVRYHGHFGEKAPPPLSVVKHEQGQNAILRYLKDLVEQGVNRESTEGATVRLMECIDRDTWNEAGLRCLGAWIDVIATRIHRGGVPDVNPKHQGDAFDLGHMASLGATDIFLMEKKYSSIGSRAAHIMGAQLIHTPADLLKALPK